MICNRQIAAQLLRKLFTVAQTSKSAVSRISKSAGLPHFQVLPTWKSAKQQVWKPALLADFACPQLNQRLRSVASGNHNMLCTTRLVAQLIGEEPWLVSCQKPSQLPLKLPVIFTPKMAGSQMKFSTEISLRWRDVEFNAKTPRRKDAGKTRNCFAPLRLCAFALKLTG